MAAVAAFLCSLLCAFVLVEPFSLPDGPLPEGWTTWDGAGWRIEDERVAPPTEDGVWLAVTQLGPSDGLTLSASVTLSPTARRANAGLAFMAADPENHLFCKIEVTEGRPDGLISLGERLHGQIVSLLASADRIGLENGQTYRVSVSRDGDRVDCAVEGGTLAEEVVVSWTLRPDQLAALGSAESGGFRVKVLWDEDDGGSRMDDLVALWDPEGNPR